MSELFAGRQHDSLLPAASRSAVCRKALWGVLFCVALSASIAGRLNAQAKTGTPLSNGTALYARLVRLSHNADATKNGTIVASVTAFPAGSSAEDIYTSTDGNNFSLIGSITDPDFSGGLCCGTLYELPSKVGSLAPGTLLWAGSVGQSSTTQAMQIKVYESADEGASWTYLSNCATGTAPGTTSGGLWEPAFTVASDGALVCFYSDEQQSGHSQLLHQVRSYDGTHWQDSTFTVASTVQADRPGMPVVTRLPDGLYFMTYEICGTPACSVFYRTSPDGWSWGDPTNLGTKVVTASGQYLEHAPYNAWAPSASANGTILLIGQMMYESNNSISAGNGLTIFTNHSADGSGAWSTMPAPVQVPNAYDNYCPNYSSPLLPSLDGQSVLEFASDYNGSTCEMYHAQGPVLAGTIKPAGVALTPASNTVTTAQSLNVSVSITSAAGQPTPTGTVTLASGSYTSSASTLSNGSATITIPANTLAVGSATLTATYSGDANFTSATGTAVVTVTQAVTPGFTITGSNITMNAGATSGNTSTITVTPFGGFTGNVSLSAQITSESAGSTLDQPLLAFGSTSTVDIVDASAGTATLTVITSEAKSGSAASRRQDLRGAYGTASLAFGIFILPFSLRSRKSRAGRALFVAVAIPALSSGLSGCSNGSRTSSVSTTPTSAIGNYVITVTGTGADATASGTVTVTVQ